MINFKKVRGKLVTSSMIFVALMLGVSAQGYAAVSITKGKTPIPNGNAIADTDITIRNNKIAFSIAIGSQPPWGVARGCIVDIANVLVGGSLSNDRVAFADFIPNNWSGWPNTHQNVNIEKDTPEEAVVSIGRDFGDVEITTTYSLKAGSDLIHVKTIMKNNGKDQKDLLSGFTLWADGGYLFPIPGYAGVASAAVKNPVADRFISYDADWSIALHAPYFTELRYKSRDLYIVETFA